MILRNYIVNGQASGEDIALQASSCWNVHIMILIWKCFVLIWGLFLRWWTALTMGNLIDFACQLCSAHEKGIWFWIGAYEKTTKSKKIARNDRRWLEFDWIIVFVVVVWTPVKLDHFRARTLLRCADFQD